MGGSLPLAAASSSPKRDCGVFRYPLFVDDRQSKYRIQAPSANGNAELLSATGTRINMMAFLK